jgi:hypothetical protein
MELRVDVRAVWSLAMDHLEKNEVWAGWKISGRRWGRAGCWVGEEGEESDVHTVCWVGPSISRCSLF